MKIPIWQVDAFAGRVFGGNPAAVCLLESWPDDGLLQAIAAENNLSETAFLEPAGEHWRLRWFTPIQEVPFCGHATLASAWVVTERLEPGRGDVVFHTASGPLLARRAGARFVLDFPPRTPRRVNAPPPALEAALGVRPLEVLHDGFNFIAVLGSAGAVRGVRPDFPAVARLDVGGVVVTAPGDDGHDCVSRYFAPVKGIDEDPVTGGAHCALTPYWTERLAKSEINAFQASARGGELICRMAHGRVELEGACAFYMQGEAEVEV